MACVITYSWCHCTPGGLTFPSPSSACLPRRRAAAAGAGLGGGHPRRPPLLPRGHQGVHEVRHAARGAARLFPPQAHLPQPDAGCAAAGGGRFFSLPHSSDSLIPYLKYKIARVAPVRFTETSFPFFLPSFAEYFSYDWRPGDGVHISLLNRATGAVTRFARRPAPSLSLYNRIELAYPHLHLYAFRPSCAAVLTH